MVDGIIVLWTGPLQVRQTSRTKPPNWNAMQLSVMACSVMSREDYGV
jgi:hypothetical protein